MTQILYTIPSLIITSLARDMTSIAAIASAVLNTMSVDRPSLTATSSCSKKNCSSSCNVVEKRRASRERNCASL